ncbi:protein shisa-5-like isoform X2 [Chelonus insularis]|uniref:protein shisa-5-like isoform X2 n=1 Tax=Chelonus insularis TaxID=460826 RepID=UPI001589357D|nr:protein shisa-5-like isoform X2 [Chelonus insularis]
MMSKIIILVFTIVLCNSIVSADKCPSNNFVDNLVSYCPGIPQIFDSSPKSYCCLDVENKYYCCDAQEYTLNTGFKIILPAIIGVLVVVTLFVFCITCLCCSCCPWYKRRHRGTVYGIHTPGVIIHPGTAPIPNQSAQMPHQPYVVHTEPSMQYPSQPPPYTVEPYAQQASYNPNFPQ